MEVEFQFSAEELRSFTTPPPRFQFWKDALAFLLFSLRHMGPGLLVVVLLGYYNLALVITALLGLYFICTVGGGRTRAAPIAEGSSPVRFRVTPDYLETDHDFSRCRLAWSTMYDVRSIDEWIIFEFKAWENGYVPARSFESDQQRLQFFRLAKQYFDEANKKASPAIGLYDDNFFAPWTQSAGLTVEYKTSGAEWAFVENNPWNEEGYSSVWQRMLINLGLFGLAIVALAVVAYVCLLRPDLTEKMPLGIQVGLFLVCFFWFFASTHFVGNLRERRQIDLVHPIRLSKRTLFISPAGLIGLMPYGVVCNRWTMYAAVLENESWIAVRHWDGTLGALVPKTAFASAKAAELFAREATTWHAAALSTADESSEADVITADDAGGENPFRSPTSDS